MYPNLNAKYVYMRGSKNK